MLFRTKLFFKKYGRIVMVWACILIAAISFSVPFLQSAAISNLQSTEIDRIQNLTAEDLKRNAEEANVTFDYSQVQSISPAAIAEAALNRVQSYALGMIAIPDLDMLLPIYKGVENTTLFYGAGTLKEDQQMGKDNYVLASHNYEYEPNLLFTPLLRSTVGMKVYLTDKEKVYVYRISEISKVNPEDVWVVDDRGKNELTLITCDDIYGNYRMIYRCDLVEVKTVDEMGSDMSIFNKTISNIDAQGTL